MTSIADTIKNVLGGGGTVSELSARVSSAQGSTVSEGAIRKALTTLSSSGDVQSVSTAAGQVWQAAQPKTAVTPTTPAPQPLSQEAKDRLNAILDAKLAELNGEPAPEEEEEEQPKPKRKMTGISVGPGRVYYPRELLGKKDVEILRENRKNRIFMALSGPPGSGKSALAKAAFGKELHTIDGNEETQLSDIVGSYFQLPDGKWEWSDGPLTVAMREGGVAFFDDVTLINPRLLAKLYPVMDGRDEVYLPRIVNGKPEVVHAQPGFYLLCAHNPGTHGAIFSEALSSRFGFQVEVSTDYELAHQMGVPDKILRVVRKLKDRDDDPWYPQMRELEIFRDVAKNHGENAAASNLLRACPEDSRDEMAEVMRIVYGTDIAPLSLGEQV